MDSLKFEWVDVLEFDLLRKYRNDVDKLARSAELWSIEQGLQPPNYKDETACMLLANYKGRYAGFLQYYSFGFTEELADECYISWVYVCPTFRHLGIAKALIIELQTFIATLLNYKCITSAVLKENKISQILHRNLGFIDTDKIGIEVPKDLKSRIDLLKWEVINGIS